MTLPMDVKPGGLLEIFQDLLQRHEIKLVFNTPFDTKELVSMDVEHNESGDFVGVGFFIPSSRTVHYFSDLATLDRSLVLSLGFIAHNGITDLECLQAWGYPVTHQQLIWDTYLYGHIIDSSLKAYGLKDMAKRELGIEYPSYQDLVGKGKSKTTLDKLPVHIVAMYNAMDCYATYKLYEKQANTHSRYYGICDYFEDLENPVSAVFQKMSNRGIHVDLGYLKDLQVSLESQKTPIELQIKNELGNINLNSPKQLLEALNAKEIWPVLKGKPSTDKRALSALPQLGVVSDLLRYSELSTLLSSFVYPYLERNQEVVHPFFNQCGTRTGRPSCSNPNLLQIPRRTENGKLVRRMFIPREGMLMGDCDYGQIEPRVLAHLSKDSALCELFNAGTDFHTYTATRLNIDRDKAKILNLSVGYRATFKSVSSQLKCTDTEAQNEIDKWWSLFPALRRWQDTLIYEVRRSGFCTTLLGRRIKVDNLTVGNPWQRQAAERQVINNVVQASAAEIMKKAMISIDKIALEWDIGLLVQVYDELLFESRNIEVATQTVEYCMRTAITLDVPLTVEGKTGESWASCH
jgi:DNA polymerase-1